MEFDGIRNYIGSSVWTNGPIPIVRFLDQWNFFFQFLDQWKKNSIFQFSNFQDNGPNVHHFCFSWSCQSIFHWIIIILGFQDCTIKLENIIKWLKSSGLKVNEKKTELCIFHRNGNTEGSLLIYNTLITSKNEINILGITFDSKLQWSSQVSRAIRGANTSLQAIKLIRKYFTTPEIVQLLTLSFYSKFYYGSKIWHIPTLNQKCKKMLLSA